ncbi:DUF2184 domain-containing protein [Castellaniella ginsengisoli]|uniref:DUF2184 domain-containing protein n=1 Tax=Castellaniella ginsengisoli TaxID=546114 RepID=A0AB39G4B6_9BURK
MPHMHYDEADVPAIHQFAAANQVSLREDQGVLAARQLDYVKARTYDRKLPPMNGLTLVPQSSDTPEWAETITYRSYDSVGMAKIIANYADDLPRVDVTGKETTVPVRTIGDSYGYNINELNASVALGARLPERKAIVARRAVEVKLNRIAMVGDSQYGLYGITNHPNIGTTGGITGSWATTATAAQIVTDVDILYAAVTTQSKDVHTPNTLAIPSTALAAMKRKYVADTGGKSAYTVVRENYPDLKIVGLAEFENVGGSSLTIIGEFSEENASLEAVMPFNQLPAQARNLELVVPCLARTGGVSVHYPLAFTKAVGI